MIGYISEKTFRVKIKLADKNMSEHSYKIITNTLLCEYILHQNGTNLVPDSCVLCQEKHDLVHVLFTCVFAKKNMETCVYFLKIRYTIVRYCIGS